MEDKHTKHSQSDKTRFMPTHRYKGGADKKAARDAQAVDGRRPGQASSDNEGAGGSAAPEHLVPSTKEVQERLNKLTLAVTVATAVTVFAVLFALWTAWSSYSQKVQLQNDVQTVIVASKDIKAGTKITEDMLAKKEIPAEYLGGGATSDASKLVGHTINIDVSAQDAVSVKMVSSPDNTSSASAQLAKDEQAFSLSVSTEDAVSGTIAQGDTVDVISVFQGKVEVLFKAKRIIALDGYLSKRTTDYKSVVLALAPDEGKKLRECQAKGHRLTLALNPESAKAGK